MKKILIVSGVLLLLMGFGIFLSLYSYSENNVIKYDSETENILYDGKTYYIFSADGAYSYVHPFYCKTELERLDYRASIYGYSTYYTDDLKEPSFIMMESSQESFSVWFPDEEFFYDDQTFVIPDTKYSFRCSDCYEEEDPIGQSLYYESYKIAEFEWYLERIPVLYSKVGIYLIEDEYYLNTDQRQNPYYYKCTAEFIDTLRSIGIIN